MSNSFKALMAVLFFSMAVASCKKDDNTNNNNNNNSGKAYVQFVNGSPSAALSQFDLFTAYSSTSPLIADFYYNFGSPYNYLALSEYANITVSGFNGTYATTGALGVESDKVYTLYFYDTLPNLKFTLLKDTVPTSLPTGYGAIKFINLSPNAGPITYRIHGGATLAANLKYAGTNPTACNSTFVQAPIGDAQYDVLDANTLQVIDSMPIYTMNVEQGKSTTVWTSGYRGGTGDNKLQTFYTKDEIVP